MTIFRSDPPPGSDYAEVLDAVDENFAAACTLFERSPAMQNPLLQRCYIKILDQAIPGDIPVDQAIDMILELAFDASG